MSDSEEVTSVAQNKVSKYKCPADFVAFSYDSSATSLRDGDEKELWLIKAPARFDPKCFNNLKVPLYGLEMLQSGGTTPQIYSVLSSRTAPSNLHLLVSDGKKQKPSLCSSSFSGVLKISESYGNCSENQTPVPVPAVPAPSIPDGLKQRFQPFGSSITSCMEDEVSAAPTAPKRTRQEPVEDEERKKKKKKKKKDKRREESEAVFIKQEETQIQCDPLEPSELKEDEPTEERKRKKKKAKKEKERESEDVVDSSLITKTEPLDPSCDYIETPVKTKKKKKKSSRNE